MFFRRRELRNCARDEECDVTENSCYTVLSVVNIILVKFLISIHATQLDHADRMQCPVLMRTRDYYN